MTRLLALLLAFSTACVSAQTSEWPQSSTEDALNYLYYRINAFDGEVMAPAPWTGGPYVATGTNWSVAVTTSDVSDVVSVHATQTAVHGLADMAFVSRPASNGLYYAYRNGQWTSFNVRGVSLAEWEVAKAGYVAYTDETYVATALDASTAWQNPASATNWGWSSDGVEITLTSYTGPANVVIPDMLDGLPVVKWGAYLFSPGLNGSGIESISGGENITVIRNVAFYNCTNLLSVSLPSVLDIGNSAFFGCSALGSVNTPVVSSIGVNAFATCGALTSVTFAVNQPVAGTNIYAGAALGVINYVTNPTATGWGETFGGRPVVRMPVATDRIGLTGASIYIDGTNLIVVTGNATNRVMLEAYP